MTAPPTVPALSETAALARKLVDASSLTRVAEFIAAQANADGGFRGRSGESDLYYTLFGVEGQLALDAPLPAALPGYLAGHGDGAALDLVHRCCLVRCLAALPARDEDRCSRLLERIEECRHEEGGYRLNDDDPWPSAYAGFVAFLAHRALGRSLPDPDAVVASVERLRAADGGIADRPGLPAGTTPVSAAAVALCVGLGRPAPAGVEEWLQARLHPRGGFLASPRAPVPDLLSTASAALALRALGRPPAAIAAAVLRFVEDCWRPGGGFAGHAFDSAVDCEYTFYGLLSLGAVAEAG